VLPSKEHPKPAKDPKRQEAGDKSAEARKRKHDLSLHPTPGLFLYSMLSDLPSAMPKTSGNIPTLQSTGPLLSFCVVKRNVTTH